jgi:hypothetical protein
MDEKTSNTKRIIRFVGVLSTTLHIFYVYPVTIALNQNDTGSPNFG